VAFGLGVGRVLRGVDHDVGAASGGERAATGRVVAGDHGAHAVGLEHQNDGEADRAAADDDGDVFLGDLGAADGVPADGHRLGKRGVVGGQPVGDGQREGLLDDELFGVGAGGGGR
jgi:hypothetical protein